MDRDRANWSNLNPHTRPSATAKFDSKRINHPHLCEHAHVVLRQFPCCDLLEGALCAESCRRRTYILALAWHVFWLFSCRIVVLLRKHHWIKFADISQNSHLNFQVSSRNLNCEKNWFHSFIFWTLKHFSRVVLSTHRIGHICARFDFANSENFVMISAWISFFQVSSIEGF